MSCTKNSTCLGLHDNGRSIGKYINTWVWGTAAFRTKSKKNKKQHKLGINISLSQEPQTASGDALWIDDKLYKLDALVITKQSPTEWHIQTYKGKGAKYPNNKVDVTFRGKFK